MNVKLLVISIKLQKSDVITTEEILEALLACAVQKGAGPRSHGSQEGRPEPRGGGRPFIPGRPKQLEEVIHSVVSNQGERVRREVGFIFIFILPSSCSTLILRSDLAEAIE